MTVADVVAALALPPESRVDRRVPKTLLVENGAPTAADRRQINDGLAELLWLAALKPSNIGVPAFRDTVREVIEIPVLSADLRPAAKASRLIELIHRAIPYPVLLLSVQAETVTLSLANKRFAQNETGSVVLDGAVTVATLESSALLPHLGLASQPRAHLLALYEGWLACLEGMQAAAITGQFVAAANVEARRTALADHARLTREIAAFRAQADRESQINRRVELNLEIKRLEAALAQAIAKMQIGLLAMKKLTADDPETKTADLIADNIERLKALFPEACTEGKIDFDVLKQLLGGAIDERDEKYGLNWHGKRRARQLALTPSTGTLRPCPEDSVDWDTTKNLMIEGDNLEVLKLLQKSYAGKVKLIYIDPPYNTGKDFVYPDNFQDNIRNYLELTGQTENGRKISTNTEASGRFHTDWLNMMYPRVKLARNLLREDGFIFISLDDVEIANARKICDDVLGEENFIDTIVWKKRYGGGAKEKYLVSIHEYIAVYARNIQTIANIEIPLSEASIERYYALRDEHFEERGPYRTHPLEAMKSFEDRPNLAFAIRAPDGSELHPKRQWRWSRERMEEALARGEVSFSKNRDGSWVASSKQYLKDDSGETRSAKAFSIIDGIYTQAGTNEIVTYFGDARVFPFPKPSQLMQKVLEIGSSESKDDLIVDFFAGSGTTADAAMTQNAQDGGKRRVILVQLPEPLDSESKEGKVAALFCDKIKKPRNIAELTKERLRRAAKKIREENPLFQGDLGFRVFKLAASNIREWEPDRANLAATLVEHAEHLRTDRTEADILFELLLKLGLDLTVPIEEKKIAGKTVHSIGAGTLLVCLAEKINAKEVEPLALGIAEWHETQNPSGDSTVVFRDSAFADDVAKTNITAILQQHGLDNVRSL